MIRALIMVAGLGLAGLLSNVAEAGDVAQKNAVQKSAVQKGPVQKGSVHSSHHRHGFFARRRAARYARRSARSYSYCTARGCR